MKTLICALFALSLHASTLTLTPDATQQSTVGVTAILIAPHPACIPSIPLPCESGEQVGFVIVDGASDAQIAITYMLDGQEYTETEPVESFGASCSAEFTLPAGASLESATVTLAAPAANAHGARRR